MYSYLKRHFDSRKPPLSYPRFRGITWRTLNGSGADSVLYQGGISVRVKGTNGVGKGPNDELTLNSDQHPDPLTRGTGSSTVANGETSTLRILDEGWQDISPDPKQTRKGFSYIELKKSDLANGGIVIKVPNDSVIYQGGISVRVKGTNGVGEGPNDELTLHSDQHPNPHTRGTGSSTVGFGKMQVLSGDDVYLAKRNDIGESWRKNFPPPLAGAGTKSKDDVGHEVDNIEANGNLDMGNGDTGDSDDEYYKQAEQRRASSTSAASSSPEPVDGNHQITSQTENSGSVQGRDGGETPDIDRDFDLTPHIGRNRGTTVEGQEASWSGHNRGSGARSGSDESDQSTGSGGTDTNEGISSRVGGDEHDEDDRDEGNDVGRRRVGELESGTRRRVRNLGNMTLVATFITIAVQSTSAIFALNLGELSPLAQRLFTGVLVTNLVGFLCLYVVLFPSRYISPRAAEILGGVGAAAAAIGFLLMMGIKLSRKIIIPACLVVLAASVLSFMP